MEVVMETQQLSNFVELYIANRKLSVHFIVYVSKVLKFALGHGSCKF